MELLANSLATHVPAIAPPVRRLVMVVPINVDLAVLVQTVERHPADPAALVRIAAFPLEAIAPTVAAPVDLAPDPDRVAHRMVADKAARADSVLVDLAKDKAALPDRIATALPATIRIVPTDLAAVNAPDSDPDPAQVPAAQDVLDSAVPPADLQEPLDPCSPASRRALSALPWARARRVASARPKSRSKPRSSTRPSRTSIK